MTRGFDIVVLVENHNQRNERLIRQAIEDNWDIECPVKSWNSDDSLLEARGRCSLSANDRPADFASRLAEAVWMANRGYCQIEVRAVPPGLCYMWSASYTTTPDNYEYWCVTGELPYVGESSSEPDYLAIAA